MSSTRDLVALALEDLLKIAPRPTVRLAVANDQKLHWKLEPLYPERGIGL